MRRLVEKGEESRGVIHRLHYRDRHRCDNRPNCQGLVGMASLE